MDTCVIQVTNVAPVATLEQMSTLFGYLGKIEQIQMYPSDDSIIQPLSRVCYVKFAESWSVGVAQHLTNTVFIDRALIVVPVPDGIVPDESKAMALTTPTSSISGMSPSSGAAQLVNQVTGVGGTQVITTVDPRLTALGLPQYPPLPANMDPTKIEEIRRTVYCGNLDSTLTAEQLLKFFNQIGEVKYVRMAGDETQPTRFAFVEFTEQASVANALQYNGVIFGGRPLKINHSNNAIVKPQAKSSEAAQREIEEAMKRVREAQSLITAAIEPERRSISKSRRESHHRSRSRSRKSPVRSKDHHSRSRSRDKRKKSPSPRIRRRTRSRSRDRVRKKSTPPRSRRDRSRSRESKKKSLRSKSGSRSRSRSPIKSKSSKSSKSKEDSHSEKIKDKDKKKSDKKDEVLEKVPKETTSESKEGPELPVTKDKVPEEKEPLDDKKPAEDQTKETDKPDEEKQKTKDESDHEIEEKKKKEKSPEKARRLRKSRSPSIRKRSKSPSKRRVSRSRSRSKRRSPVSPVKRRRSRSRSISRRRRLSPSPRRRRSRSPMPRRRSRSPWRSRTPIRSSRSRRVSRSPRRSRTPKRRSRTPKRRSRSRSPKREPISKHKKKKDKERDRSRERDKDKKRKRKDKDDDKDSEKVKESKVKRDYDEEEKGYDSGQETVKKIKVSDRESSASPIKPEKITTAAASSPESPAKSDMDLDSD
ncbi:serine/arginine-rich splicing factor 11-like [Limulus polyphemus]|uniref:Serine/arginine-rich splicing factor 11-like n=1 Tax=Limulus polyphemus TaxID=6850 RepID=A0ABM1BEF8_LIMPO|nr:serine/arginine-rich splicing factor 11-like [Limulus polyphemus]